jgi:anthranilate phosphoribosyltransferase
VTVQAILAKLIGGATLASGEAETMVHAIATAAATPAQIGAWLALLRSRGETAAEIAGAARALRERMVRVHAPPGPVVDTCGTGGDATGSSNISTLAALVVAAAGLTVAKHGNRAVSSQVGSADLLEALGVALDLPPAAAEAALAEHRFAFLFAPRYHSALQHAAAPRRELAVRTIFNLVGPLVNPAGATHQVVGVWAPELVPVVAAALRDLGTTRALVVHGEDGSDEISLAGPTRAALVEPRGVVPMTLHLESAGVTPQPLAALAGGDRDARVAAARRVLGGEPGPLQDAVALNAGAALWIADAAGDWAEGVRQARRVLASGAAATLLTAIAALGRQEER